VSADPHTDGLVGVDGLEGPEPVSLGADPARKPLRLSAQAGAVIRSEVERAGGREVCFLCDVTDAREVVRPRAVARGNRSAVLAVARDAPAGALLVHNHPSGLLEPSDADLSVAARAWEEGLGTAITDNGGASLYVVVEPPAPRVVHALDVDGLAAVLSPVGALAALHEGYEDREGQRTMLRLVAERYNEGGVALVEAGTGTGKSLAYLLPAAAWALTNRERTVVSTNTINLQAQLVRKDLPLVGRLVASPDDPGSPELTWALVKGRGNYLSIRRALLAAEGAPTLFEDDRSGELASILEWAEGSEEGSLQDLPFIPESDTWEEVRSDPDICLRGKCPHFQECFYQKSRRRAASADIVVVNHHLLFTDTAVRRATDNWSQSAVLPAYDRLVLDEAHNLEDAATSHLGVEVTRAAMMRLLSRLDRKGKGVLAAIQAGLRGQGDRASKLSALVEERVRPALEGARAAALNFIDCVEPLVPVENGEAVRIGEGEGTLPEPTGNADVRGRLERLLGALSDLERLVGQLRRRIDPEEALAEKLEGRVLDLQSIERRLAAHQYALALVLTPSEEQEGSYVRWVEVRGSGRRANLALAAAPVELGPVLRDSLFARTDTVVLSSATLATRRRFDFLRGRVGLDPEGLAAMERPPPVVEAVVPSPFDFGRQVLFGVPTDLPDPRTGDAALQVDTARVTRDLAELTGGGLFVLFTSHRALRRVAEHLRDDGVDRRWPLFVQGEDERARLLADFVRSKEGILLGTSSFWEGVDVPGHPLRGLIIQKLPFRVPTEPVTAARVEAIEARGGNAFYEFMLPLAALRLKQGFGRLIRSRSDRGAVLLLDDRIVRKRYGRYLRASLPDAPLAKGPWQDLERALRRFYESADSR
jgi:ATP-dependent DNA helicase DinG